MKVVRGLWGWEKDRLDSEIPDSPIFKNEICYVWGEYQRDYLRDRGYETIYMGNKLYYPFQYKNLEHKVFIIVHSGVEFNEFIYIDWDVRPVRELDYNFWNSFKKYEFATSLYSYPLEYLSEDFNRDEPIDWWHYVIKLHMQAYDIGWISSGLVFLPNCGITYISDKSISNEYSKLNKKYNKMLTVCDEFFFYMLANCSLNDYIQNHTSEVMFGRPDEYRHSNIFSKPLSDTANKVCNDYLRSNKNMNIYLKHI